MISPDPQIHGDKLVQRSGYSRMKENRPQNYNMRSRTPSFLTSSEGTESRQDSQSSNAESQQQSTLDNAAGHQETGAHQSPVQTGVRTHLTEGYSPALNVQVPSY